MCTEIEMPNKIRRRGIKEFHLETGLRQSDTLSSARFTIVLKTVINETLNKVTGITVRNNQQMVVAAYAGGSTIMAEDE